MVFRYKSRVSRNDFLVVRTSNRPIFKYLLLQFKVLKQEAIPEPAIKLGVRVNQFESSLLNSISTHDVRI